jgi:hypothetical protein
MEKVVGINFKRLSRLKYKTKPRRKNSTILINLRTPREGISENIIDAKTESRTVTITKLFVFDSLIFFKVAKIFLIFSKIKTIAKRSIKYKVGER